MVRMGSWVHTLETHPGLNPECKHRGTWWEQISPNAESRKPTLEMPAKKGQESLCEDGRGQERSEGGHRLCWSVQGQGVGLSGPRVVWGEGGRHVGGFLATVWMIWFSPVARREACKS